MDKEKEVIGDIPQIKPVQSALNPPKIELDTGAVGLPETQKPKFSKFKSRFKLRSLKRPSLPRIGGKTKKVLVGSLGTFVLVVIVLITFVVMPAINVYKKGQKLQVSARDLKDSFNSQDINIVKTELSDFKIEFLDFQKSYNRLGWTGALPLAGNYYKDGDAGLKAGVHGINAAELTLETITPFADIIGFAGPDSGDAQSGEDTANDRIDFIVQSLDVFIPKMDELTAQVDAAGQELERINPNRYPEQIKGVPIRSTLAKYLNLADQGADFVRNAKPLMEAAPLSHWTRRN